MRRSVLVVCVVTFAGCSDTIVRDTRPSFRIDAAQPFRLEFGRGSGWRGLETIQIDQTGGAVLHRLKWDGTGGWETTSVRLAPQSLAKVLKSVESNGLMELHRSYRDPGVHDGTQWVFWVQQGEREKTVYCDNSFPRAMTRFAEQLDAILTSAGLGEAVWQPVPAEKSRRHDRELWESIRR